MYSIILAFSSQSTPETRKKPNLVCGRIFLAPLHAIMALGLSPGLYAYISIAIIPDIVLEGVFSIFAPIEVSKENSNISVYYILVCSQFIYM